MPFFDNKQMIHMAAESVLLVIILFYVSYQNKKLRVGLNTCTKRLKEQELIIQTHDKVLKNHEMVLRNLVQEKGVSMPKTAVSKPAETPKTPEKKPPVSPEKMELPCEESPTIEIIEEEIQNELHELVEKKETHKETKDATK